LGFSWSKRNIFFFYPVWIRKMPAVRKIPGGHVLQTKYCFLKAASAPPRAISVPLKAVSAPLRASKSTKAQLEHDIGACGIKAVSAPLKAFQSTKGTTGARQIEVLQAHPIGKAVPLL
jgi:hypothetical protein